MKSKELIIYEQIRDCIMSRKKMLSEAKPNLSCVHKLEMGILKFSEQLQDFGIGCNEKSVEALFSREDFKTWYKSFQEFENNYNKKDEKQQ